MTTRIECSKYFAQRDDALRAHATQIDPNGDFFRAPDGMAAAALADRGVRVGPVARAGALPETDLFAGIERTDE